VVGIATGIRGHLDPAQLAWLRRVAAERDVAKVLVTGTPLAANGAVRRDDPVLGVVEDPAARFVAVFAGGVHNYQRRPVGGVQHVVCGGGGAYLNATHAIPRLEDEDALRLYPLRGDSLAWFSRRFEAWAKTRTRRGRRLVPFSEIAPDAAAACMAERLGLVPVRASAQRESPSFEDRAAAARFFPPPGVPAVRRLPDRAWDTDEPPFFRHFVRCDVTSTALRVRCFGVSGSLEDERDPPVEDDVTVALS
jgi:hypothetical protein